jgi:hypothetical protein
MVAMLGNVLRYLRVACRSTVNNDPSISSQYYLERMFMVRPGWPWLLLVVATAGFTIP